MGVGVAGEDEDPVLKDGVKVKLEGRKMGSVAELGFLETRDRVFGERVLNEMSVLLMPLVFTVRTLMLLQDVNAGKCFATAGYCTR